MKRIGLAAPGLWLASALLLIGCAAETVPTGGARITVRAAALSAEDIDRVEITVEGAGIDPPIARDLTGDAAAGWSGTIAAIPAGTDRTFTGRAWDDGGVLLYEGVATPVTVRTDETALVTIFLQQVAAPTPFSNTAPRITGLTVSSYTVAPGGTVSLSVTAEDPDPGDTLTYAWTAASGAFSSPAAPATDWTAPAAPGSAVLRIGVADPTGATATLEIGVTIEGAAGGAFVMVDVNSAPTIVSLVPSPAQIDLDDNTYLDLTASDPDGDPLTYLWSVEWPCEGVFDDATVEDATFYLTAVQDEWDDCVLSVRVSDGRGGRNTATIAVATGPDVCDGTICGPPLAQPGELLWDAWRHHDGDDVAGDITYDPVEDRVILVGSHSELDDPVIVIDVFTAAGSYIDSLFPEGAEQERAYAAATTSAGTGILGGWSNTAVSSGLVRQHPSGWFDEGWEYEFEGAGVFDVLVDRNDNAWFIGVAGVSAARDIRVTRMDPVAGPTGLVLDRFARPGTVLRDGGGLATDTAGHVVACASFSNGISFDVWLGKYTLDHDEVFTTTWGATTPLDRDDICEAVAVDGLGNIYVVGHVAMAGDTDLWVAKFDASGTFLSESTFDDGGDELGHAVTVASNGIVYVAGEGDGGGQQAILRAYRPTLATFWTAHPPTRDAVGLLLEPATGELLVTGTAGVDTSLWFGRFVP